MKSYSAFSLVELSIVLVILGLLTGGILTGQSLIRAAELRAVTTEAEQFATAANTFKAKYFALPGDISNATAFWGAFGSCGNSGLTSTGTQTCNGNGNGQFDDVSSDATKNPPYTPGASRVNEIFLFWQHLARAGLVNGNYSGVTGPSGSSGRDVVFNTNAPASKLSNAGWAIAQGSYAGATNVRFQQTYGTSLEFGATSSGNDTDDPVLTAEEAWNIDMKTDDGRPGRGKLLAMHWDNDCSDGTSRTDFDADYRLNDTSAQCALVFVDPF